MRHALILAWESGDTFLKVSPAAAFKLRACPLDLLLSSTKEN